MVTTTLVPPPVKIAPFPLAAVEAKLRDELVEAVKIEGSIRGMALPAAPADIAKTRSVIIKWQSTPQISRLTAR